MFSLLEPSLLVAAGASFVAGVLGTIIVRMWIKPILGYHLAKRRLGGELARYLSGVSDADQAVGTEDNQKRNEATLRSARKIAMNLVARYDTELPYWYRLMLINRKESPGEASGQLTNLTKIRDPEQRRARIDTARKALKLH
jgi:hypothetical protein